MSTHSRLRRGFGISLVLACMVVAGCENKVTVANFEKIKNGMSLSEVERILGSGTDDTSSAGYGASTGGVMTSTAAPEKTYLWKSGGITLQVIFKDGKVVQKTKMGE